MKHTRQKGVALVTVLMVVALATFSMVSIAYRLQLDIRHTENTLNQGQALQIAKLAEQVAKHYLILDSAKNTIDDLSEDWAKVKGLKIVFEGIPVEAEIIDLQGRFNINRLSQTGAKGKEARRQFRRLLTLLNINRPGLENTIADFIDKNQEIVGPGGAEDVTYMSLDIPYLTANQALKSPSELRLMWNISKQDYETLLPFIATLPATTSINVNTASPEVLATINAGLNLNTLQSVLADRNTKPFKTVEDFTVNKAFAGMKIDAAQLSVTTDYFLLKSTVFFGGIQQKQQVIFERQKTKVRSIMHAEGEI